jgi:hypothetical protein
LARAGLGQRVWLALFLLALAMRAGAAVLVRLLAPLAPALGVGLVGEEWNQPAKQGQRGDEPTHEGAARAGAHDLGELIEGGVFHDVAFHLSSGHESPAKSELPLPREAAPT